MRMLMAFRYGKIFQWQRNYQTILSYAFDFRYCTLLDISFSFTAVLLRTLTYTKCQTIQKSLSISISLSPSLSTINCELFVFGDFNAHLVKWLNQSNANHIIRIANLIFVLLYFSIKQYTNLLVCIIILVNMFLYCFLPSLRVLVE